MLYRSLIAAAFVLVAAPAFAYESKCVAPIAPNVPNGTTATADQLHQVAADVKTFIAKSDDYQNCLLTELKTAKATADQEKHPLDKKIGSAIQDDMAANQREKERIGAEYNVSAKAYNDAHKGK